MVTRADFQKELDSILSFAKQKRLVSITIKSGELHRIVGEYPGKDHRMPICCDVMRANMSQRDEELSAPPKGMGATLVIQYKFPRN